MTSRNTLLLKRALLLFWALWLTLVLATNVFDACKVVGLLPETWLFASGNYTFLVQTTARYGTPASVNAVLFAGVLLWEAVAAALFWLACFRFRGKSKGMPTVYLAFTASLTLWLAFMVADEVFIGYTVEATHLRLFIGQLLTLLAIELLREGTTEAAP
jgi:hypothetical protein